MFVKYHDCFITRRVFSGDDDSSPLKVVGGTIIEDPEKKFEAIQCSMRIKRYRLKTIPAGSEPPEYEQTNPGAEQVGFFFRGTIENDPESACWMGIETIDEKTDKVEVEFLIDEVKLSWVEEDINNKLSLNAAQPGKAKVNFPLAPRLSRGINDTRIVKPEESKDFMDRHPGYASLNFANPKQAEMIAILDWIGTRLTRGLDAVWLAEDIRTNRWLYLYQPGGGTSAQASDIPAVLTQEETWARSLSEIAVGLPYSTPGSGYVGNYKKTNRFLMKMQDENDPVYPLFVSCQTLSSFSAITRGFNFPAPPAAMSHGYQTQPNSMAPFGGRWYTEDTYQSPMAAWTVGMAQGTVWAWDNDDTTGKQQNHIAALIRVFDVGSDEKPPTSGWIQFIDVGPWINWDKAVLEDYFGIFGAMDYHLHQDASGRIWKKNLTCTATEVPPRKYKGIGIVPTTLNKGRLAPQGTPSEPDDALRLQRGVARCRRARPLGFARLVLRLLPTKKLLLATPRLIMHDPAIPDMNFSLARFLWSLREVPGREHIEATWEIDIPRHGFATWMVESSTRAQLTQELITQYPNPTGKDPPSYAAFVNLVSLSNGKVEERTANVKSALPYSTKHLPKGYPIAYMDSRDSVPRKDLEPTSQHMSEQELKALVEHLTQKQTLATYPHLAYFFRVSASA